MRKSDSIGIVLGGGVSKKGEMSSEAKARIKKTFKLLENGKIKKLILTGRSSLVDGSKTEAKAYVEYLLKHGVKQIKLILEEKSCDTIGNAVYTKNIIIKRRLPRNVIVITSRYHLKRALLIFRHVFGRDYKITGASSGSSLFHFFSFLKELEKTELDTILLAEVPVGDHHKAEKFIKKYLPMYQK